MEGLQAVNSMEFVVRALRGCAVPSGDADCTGVEGLQWERRMTFS